MGAFHPIRKRAENLHMPDRASLISAAIFSMQLSWTWLCVDITLMNAGQVIFWDLSWMPER